jgi:pimeloyl-ACP methyl ester carboxylesterase
VINAMLRSFTILAVLCTSPSFAQQPEDDSPGLPNIVAKTLGGRQFWGDVAVFHHWRIQRNVLTGHYRLLDPRDYRYAWGTLQDCLDKLESIKTERRLAPMSGKAVIVVHGLMRSSKSFAPMQEALEQAGYLAIAFDYPSGHVDVHEAAGYLRSVIASLEGIEEIHLVAHSLGGLVIRAYAAEDPDPRVKRLVMLGVPNKGAELADLLKTNPVFRMVTGPAGQQLTTDPEGLIASLPVPPFEFAVFAGGRGNENGYNPLIPGDDDGTVAVESALLEGAGEAAVFPCRHFSLPTNEEIIERTIQFLRGG